MKVAIVELHLRGHYPSVQALIEIYCSNPANSIDLYCSSQVADALTKTTSQRRAVRVIVANGPVEHYRAVDEARRTGYDRVHVNTFEMAPWLFMPLLGPRTYVTVHNTYTVFPRPGEGPPAFHTLNLLVEISRSPLRAILTHPIQAASRAIAQHAGRVALIQAALAHRATFVVLSESIARHLSHLGLGERIAVVPFSVFSGIEDRSGEDRRLRLCVPGTLSAVRRDYDTLFDILDARASTLQGRLVLDLLGSEIPGEGAEGVRRRALELQAKGVEVLLHSGFVSDVAFLDSLSRADLILGNLRARLGRRSRYSITKESGCVFAMIRAGKPGLLPRWYGMPPEFANACLWYDKPGEIGAHIQTLLTNASLIERLKEGAKRAAESFSPKAVYAAIVR